MYFNDGLLTARKPSLTRADRDVTCRGPGEQNHSELRRLHRHRAPHWRRRQEPGPGGLVPSSLTSRAPRPVLHSPTHQQQVAGHVPPLAPPQGCAVYLWAETVLKALHHRKAFYWGLCGDYGGAFGPRNAAINWGTRNFGHPVDDLEPLWPPNTCHRWTGTWQWVGTPTWACPQLGSKQRRQVARNPENTVFDAKRLIGRKFQDPVARAF